MKQNNFKDSVCEVLGILIGIILGVAMSGGIFFVFGMGLKSCSENAQEDIKNKHEYAATHSYTYEVTYIDGYKDTISVCGILNGNDVTYYPPTNGTLLSSGNAVPYLIYFVYDRSTDKIVKNRCPNVIRYKKL